MYGRTADTSRGGSHQKQHCVLTSVGRDPVLEGTIGILVVICNDAVIFETLERKVMCI